MEWTSEQIMAARAITLIQQKLEPKCGECGYGADRPKCAYDMGGYCPRHNQEDLRNFNSVIESVSRAGKLSTLEFDKRWDLHMPLHLYQDFNETEVKMLMDLSDNGSEFKARHIDDKWWKLSAKNTVSISSQYDKYTVKMTKRGEDLVTHFKETVS